MEEFRKLKDQKMWENTAGQENQIVYKKIFFYTSSKHSLLNNKCCYNVKKHQKKTTFYKTRKAE